MPLRTRLQKRVHSKNEPFDISAKFFTDDMITTDLNTNKKIMAFIEQFPDEVRCINKHKYLREVKKEELLVFFGTSHATGLFGKNFLKLRQLFSVDNGHPIYSASMSFNHLVFINTMISLMVLTRDKNNEDQTDLLHL